ncbi:MAG: BrnT family toxin [Desulfobacteraceae bacterium]|nr:BrnT family toxin [Desulfobacteraceae bacterium]
MPICYTFEWDPEKAYYNHNKHGIAFDEAATVFKDPKALSIFDPDHSSTEDRWITMGISEKGRLLVVSHTFLEENKNDIIIRIISSRKATKQETKSYGES